MDLKGWTKESEDEKTATLKHPKGHTMVIALKSLPKIQREAIARLKMADGGMARKMYADSDEPVAKDDSAPTTDQSDQATPQASAAPAANITINTAPQPTQMPAVGQGKPPEVQAPTMPQANQVQPTGSGQQQVSQQYLNAIEQQKSANQGQAALVSAQAQAMAPAEKAKLEGEQQIADFNMHAYNDMTKAVQTFDQQNRDNPVREDAYRQDMSTERKIASAIGLAFGGLGSAFGGQNLAYDFLNKQIDRNIAAQKERFDRNKTVYGAYLNLYHDSNVAEKLARASNDSIYAQKAALVQNQLQTPQSNIAFQKLNSQLMLDKEESIRGAAQILGAKYRAGNIPGAQVSGMAKQIPGKTSESPGPVPKPAPGQPLTPAQKAAGWSLDESGGIRSPVPGQAPAKEESNAPVRLLNNSADQKYETLKYDKTKTPAQIAAISDQYNVAKNTDQQLKAIEEVFPKLMKNATYSGLISENVNPHALGAGLGVVGGGIGGAASLMGAPFTGGASLAAAAPMAATGAGIGAALGEGLGHGIQQLGGLAGGQQEIQYKTARAALVGYIGNALAGTKVTPTEIGALVEDFIPTKRDSPESARFKLQELEKKIVSLANAGALDDAKMTNRSK